MEKVHPHVSDALSVAIETHGGARLEHADGVFGKDKDGVMCASALTMLAANGDEAIHHSGLDVVQGDGEPRTSVVERRVMVDVPSCGDASLAQSVDALESVDLDHCDVACAHLGADEIRRREAREPT